MLKLINISKVFPGVKALNKISLEILPGEVHAICGENGAGKSTLMNIIAGNILSDEGEIFWKKEKLVTLSRKQAKQAGIGIVYQERSLVDSLSIAENIFAEQLPVNKWGLTDRKALLQQTTHLLQSLGISYLNPLTPVYRLSAAQQQMVEIAKALAQYPQLLLLDEPTASITEKEKETLFAIIRKLKAGGVSIIYISHRMAEIRNIADRITVLKDGTYQGTVLPADASDESIIKMMIGRELTAIGNESFAKEELVLQVKELSGKKFSDISFDVFKGEILGIAGLIGAGRTELARAIFGADKTLSGEITLNSKPFSANHPANAIRNGIVYLSEERKSLGMFPAMSVQENMVVALAQLSTTGKARNANELFKNYQQKLAIKAVSPLQKIMYLSGGNQQKVLLGRCLAVNPKLLIADEPTHGIDAGTRFEIYRLIKQLASGGMGIILISSELTELLSICDRIGIMSNGRLQKILNKEEASEEKIMQYAYAAS
jgi:ribose transport system ATP-binding protein